jgi:hypothetical protein
MGHPNVPSLIPVLWRLCLLKGVSNVAFTTHPPLLHALVVGK